MADTSNNSRKSSSNKPPRKKFGTLSSHNSLSSMASTSSHSGGGGASSGGGGGGGASSSNSSSSSSNNPITNDVKLNILVHDKLDKITKYKKFQRWKTQFLTRLDSFLSQSGIAPAKQASEEIQTHLETCLKRSTVLLKHIEKGDLSPTTGKKTVRASLALKEFCNSLEQCRVELQELVPASKIEERRRQYTKFHVGASLISEGFPQYVAMKEIVDCVHNIADKTRIISGGDNDNKNDNDNDNDHDCLDKQQRQLFVQYETQVSRFCDVMADLDLYNIMLKCVQFFHPPQNDESDDEGEELTIFVRRYRRPPATTNKNRVGRSLNNNNNNNNGNDNDNDIDTNIDIDIDGGADDNNDTDSDDASFGTRSSSKVIKVDVEDHETIATMSILAAEELGFKLKPLAATKSTTTANKNENKDDDDQLLTVRYGDNIVVENPKRTTLRDLGIENGDVLTIEQTLIYITVRQTIASSGETIEIDVLVDDPTMTTLRELKIILEQQKCGHKGLESISAEDQILFLGNMELTDDNMSCAEYGIISGSVLDLDAYAEPIVEEEVVIEEDDDSKAIVIVDTKYGTMFSVDRKSAIEKGVLTPKAINDNQIFLEATEKDLDKDRMLKSMLSSPNLNVKPQIVIEKLKIEDYQIKGERADDVKNMWGVQLKKTNKKKRGTEIFFVDFLTKAVGFLDRPKLMELEFITPTAMVVVVVDHQSNDNDDIANTVAAAAATASTTGGGDNKKKGGDNEETLEQAEKDPQRYDFFVREIRQIFGIGYLESKNQ